MDPMPVVVGLGSLWMLTDIAAMVLYIKMLHYLAMKMVMLVDVGECMMRTHQCEQNCHNTVGGYTCSCNTGYTLNRNNFTCDGVFSVHC